MKKLNIRRYPFDRGPHSDIAHVVYIDRVDVIQLFLSLEFNPIEIINTIISEGLLCPTYYSMIHLDETYLNESFYIYAYTIKEVPLLIYMLFFEKINNIYKKYFDSNITHIENIFELFNTYLIQEQYNIELLSKYADEDDIRYDDYAKFFNTRMTRFVKGYMSGLYKTNYGTSIGDLEDGFIENIICKIPEDRNA